MKLWIDRTGNATDFTLQSFPIIHRLSLGTDDQLIDGMHQDRVRALVNVHVYMVVPLSRGHPLRRPIPFKRLPGREPP